MRNPIDSAVVDPQRRSRDASQLPEDVVKIRDNARADVRQGAVTADYAAHRDEVLRMLDGVLATELVCMLRYRRCHFVAQGLAAKAAADEFLEHAREEQEHADRVAARIVQLGGSPDLRPETLAERSHADYFDGEKVEDMITENLIAERIAIESYRGHIRALGDRDPTTRRLLESILETEEEHAEDLVSLLPR